jgi:hypothetical protein
MNVIALIMRLTGASKLVAVIGLVVALFCVMGLAKCAYDRSIIDAHDAKVTAKTLKTDSAAKEAAAMERAADTAKINQIEKDRNDEIRKAPDSKPSAARNRLNCARMAKSGMKLPATCKGITDER